MNYLLLIQNFRRSAEITLDEEAQIIPLLIERSFKKGQFITTAGEVNKFTNFIVSGSTRVFYISKAGQEHNIQLGISGWWTGDFPSFNAQQSGLLFTEALEPTQVLSISYDNLQLLFNCVPKIERVYRLLIQNAYASFHQRVLYNLSYDAEQRYQLFKATYPELDRNISQKHIASYLGISPEFLSKIKRRLVEKEKNKTID